MKKHQSAGTRIIPDLPAKTFADAYPLLRAPFTAAALGWKPQAVWPKDNPTHGIVVGYIDARQAGERLNYVTGDNWSVQFSPATDRLMWAHLTLYGVTRSDVGEGSTGKALVSDAFKRSAVHFGVGVSIYAQPKRVLKVNDGHLKPRRSRDGTALELTEAGSRHVRAMYEQWLVESGIREFGEPISHGDFNDEETMPAEAEPQTAITTAEALELTDQLKALRLPTQQVVGMLHNVGVDMKDHPGTKPELEKSLLNLTPAQAASAKEMLSNMTVEKGGEK